MSAPINKTSTGGRLGFAGFLDFKDAAGNVLKTVELNGSFPLEELGLTEKQAADLVAQANEETSNGDHDCE